MMDVGGTGRENVQRASLVIQLLLLTTLPTPPHKTRSFYSIVVSKRISCTFCEIISIKIPALVIIIPIWGCAGFSVTHNTSSLW